jgi:hypothetical protein
MPKKKQDTPQDISDAIHPPHYHVRHTKHFAFPLVLMALAITFVSVLFIFGPVITGFVSFTEKDTKVVSEGFSVDTTGSVILSTGLDDISSMLLSGTVRGKGKAAVFLLDPGSPYLAYYFEGDAGSGIRFDDMCYDTCHLAGVGNDLELWFELDGMTIDIDKVSYEYTKTVDFDLQPRKVGIQYGEGAEQDINMQIRNKDPVEYRILIEIEGPLSDFFSWQASMVHVSDDDAVKPVPVRLSLPANLPKGEYIHKVTARFIHPDTNYFHSELPVAESFITVYNN